MHLKNLVNLLDFGIIAKLKWIKFGYILFYDVLYELLNLPS